MSAQVLPSREVASGHPTSLLWVIGRYLADGWRVDRKGRRVGRVVICSNDEKLPELEAKLREANLPFTLVKERTVTKLHITQGWLYELLEPFGRLAHGKTLPGWCLEYPPNEAKALLDGYLSGDGSRPKGTKQWSASSTSPQLTLGLALLAHRALGRVARVYCRQNPTTCVIEGRTVNQRDSYELRISDAVGHSVVEGSYAWRPLRESVPGGDHTVYNISVEGDESYVANGAVVHNCQDVSPPGSGAGLAGARSGLWAEFARIVEESAPSWVFIENSSFLRVRGLGTVLEDLDRLGYDAEWGVLGADAPAVAFGSETVAVIHNRDRMWIVAHRRAGTDTDGERREEQRRARTAAAEHAPVELCRWWETEPAVGRVVDRLACRVERLKRIGNGQVPAVAALAWQVLSTRLLNP